MYMAREKIRSQRGASVSFSLMLFLVCTILATVILVAATTGSGRMANIPNIDQRYYSVSSAAELLSSLIDDHAVSVVRTEITPVVSKYKLDGTLLESASLTPSTGVALYSNDVTDIGSLEGISGISGLSGGAATEPIYMVGRNYSMLTQLADDLEDPTKTVTQEIAYKLSASGPSTVDGSILGVEIYQKIEDSGAMMFWVSRPSDSDPASEGYKNRYTLKLTFAADRSQKEFVSTERDAPVREAFGDAEPKVEGYSITEHVTKTTTIVYKWTLIGIVKDSWNMSWSTTGGA